MKKIHHFPTNIDDQLKTAEENYKFQPELTRKLDTLPGEFSETTLLEIVLWKTNRYSTINKDIIDAINDLRKNYSDDKAKELLRLLLKKENKGFDLPMASTVLRFASPDRFQIIDQRVYRFITPEKDFLKIPYYIDKKIDLYFDYIERLKEVCHERNIPFSKADRILYQMDKDENKNFPLKTYARN